MSNNPFSPRIEAEKDNDRINILVKQLKSKLINFALMDRQGDLSGDVKDLIVDKNRQLNLVVSPIDTAQRFRFFLVTSKLIKKVDAVKRLVFLDINKGEIENLPEYITTETPSRKVSDAPEPADEGATKDSERAKSVAIPTPVELKDIQEKLDNDSALFASETPEVFSEEIIRLLGERVVVERSKRKVGEVIVRKEIETRMVQVEIPVRREKLIVEQVSPERKKLAEIDLGQEEITVSELVANASQSKL